MKFELRYTLLFNLGIVPRVAGIHFVSCTTTTAFLLFLYPFNHDRIPCFQISQGHKKWLVQPWEFLGANLRIIDDRWNSRVRPRLGEFNYNYRSFFLRATASHSGEEKKNSGLNPSIPLWEIEIQSQWHAIDVKLHQYLSQIFITCEPFCIPPLRGVSSSVV